MAVSTLAIWGLAVLAGVLLFRWVHRLRLERSEKAWLPMELQHAALVYMERVFKADAPVPMVARLDRGYRNAAGVIVLVELKTRHVDRVYLADVIELSAQRLAVEAQTKEIVAPHAYVLIQRTQRRQKSSHRVQLLPYPEVVALLKRRDALLAGEEEGRYTQWPELCPKCTFRQQCCPPFVYQRENQSKGSNI